MASSADVVYNSVKLLVVLGEVGAGGAAGVHHALLHHLPGLLGLGSLGLLGLRLRRLLPGLLSALGGGTGAAAGGGVPSLPGLLGGGSLGQIPTIAGVGTIVTAFFMGPLIEFFNVRVARPMLSGPEKHQA